MKKILIGIAAVASMAATPVFAGGLDTAWNTIDQENASFSQLVIGTAIADPLDQCANNKPFYTVFIPSNDVLNQWLDDNNLTVVTLLANNRSVAVALINDHIGKGSFAPSELQNPSVTRIPTISGYNLTKTLYGEDVFIDGFRVLSSTQVCNGWVYWIDGLIDSSAQVPTTGLNNNVPDTTTAPATESLLPNTL